MSTGPRLAVTRYHYPRMIVDDLALRMFAVNSLYLRVQRSIVAVYRGRNMAEGRRRSRPSGTLHLRSYVWRSDEPNISS